MSTPQADAYAVEAVRLSAEAGVTPTARVAYGSTAAQRFDVYAPPNARGLPVLVFLHGGAWTHGGLEWLGFMAPAVMALPAVFVGVSYRLAPQHRWPAAFDDTCAALGAVHSYAQQHGFDTRRIIVSGHSAGGHLASLAALRGNFDWLKACFPVSSRFDLRTSNPLPGSGEERVYKLVLADPSQDAEASPICFVEGSRLPFHIIWGGDDFERVSTSSVTMVQALKEQGVSVSHNIVPGAGHFDMHLQLVDPSNAWYARVKQEFEKC